MIIRSTWTVHEGSVYPVGGKPRRSDEFERERRARSRTSAERLREQRRERRRAQREATRPPEST